LLTHGQLAAFSRAMEALNVIKNIYQSLQQRLILPTANTFSLEQAKKS
jgi:hypothetical protein